MTFCRGRHDRQLFLYMRREQRADRGLFHQRRWAAGNRSSMHFRCQLVDKRFGDGSLALWKRQGLFGCVFCIYFKLSLFALHGAQKL